MIVVVQFVDQNVDQNRHTLNHGGDANIEFHRCKAYNHLMTFAFNLFNLGLLCAGYMVLSGF